MQKYKTGITVSEVKFKRRAEKYVWTDRNRNENSLIELKTETTFETFFNITPILFNIPREFREIDF
jgi:hypothetical protein